MNLLFKVPFAEDIKYFIIQSSLGTEVAVIIERWNETSPSYACSYYISKI